MNNPLSWGTPITDAEVAAFEAAATARAASAGQHAAADAVDAALDRIARLSLGLVQAQALFLLLALLLTSRGGGAAAAGVSSLLPWSIPLMLVSCLLLLSNLLPTTARRQPVDPRARFEVLMQLHKTRAPRYTIGLVFAFVAVLVILLALLRAG